MYANKLAVAIKANGKVLREFKDTVYVPFGTEYTILIKNLNTVRAQVKVNIDNSEATEGTWLVVPANGEIELQRFIKNGNLQQGNRFKFIERTAQIENGSRGIKIDDGIIRIEYQFERRAEPVQLYNLLKTPDPIWHDKRQFITEPYWCAMAAPAMPQGSGVAGLAAGSSLLMNSVVSYNAVGQNAVSQTSNDAYATATLTTASYTPPPVVENEAGITVAGSVSDQRFHTSAWFPVESTINPPLVIRLLGETESGTPVVKPVTVKSKAKCSTCDHLNKATAKFCSECGTSLVIV